MLLKEQMKAYPFSHNERVIIDYILEHGQITNKEVQQLLSVKDSRALKILKELAEQNIIEKCGKLKGSYYKIRN